MDKRAISTDFVKRLDDNLKIIREVSAQYQAKIAKERIQEEERHNQYAVGDLVLKTVTTPTKPRKRKKLGVGPWEVLEVHSNDYRCKHVTENNEQNRTLAPEIWLRGLPYWIMTPILFWRCRRTAGTLES